MKMIPAARLGWVAAVFDMKANVVRKNNKMRATPQVVLMVESKEWNIIRELARLTGSMAEPQQERNAKNFMRRGCTVHCPDAHVHVPDEWTLPPIARWTITGAGAAIILHNVIPYMQNAAKKGFPELLEEICGNLVLTGQGSGQVMKTIHRLQGLGWDLPPAMTSHLEPEFRIITA
jgi:hypothetical protein